MNGNGVVLEAKVLNFPINNTENEAAETLIFEETRIETVEVSEIRPKDAGTRFARLKKVLRKRSASIL